MNPSYPTTYNYSGGAVPEGAGMFMAIFGGMMVLFYIAIYIYLAICLMKMAHKTNTRNAWFAWIPILDFILLVEIAGKSIWWVFLCFIPFINIIIAILIWMAAAKRLGKPSWLGILMILPIVNFIVPGYLAFSSSENINPVQPQPPISPIPPTATM